jgi:hypothetical protein
MIVQFKQEVAPMKTLASVIDIEPATEAFLVFLATFV